MTTRIVSLLFSYIFGFLVIDCNLSAQVYINTTGTDGNASAMLDVDSNNKGILIPRVSLTSTSDVTTIASPTISLMVYNTATAGTLSDSVVPGFYYWDGTKWISITGQGSRAGILAFADFFAIMPPDNSATIAAGFPVAFPNLGSTNGTTISAISNTQFQLAAIGTYMVSWQAIVTEAGQLVLELNGTEDLNMVVGRATGACQIVGNRLITTTTANTILRIVNPTGNATTLTLTVSAGGARPVSASLVIMRIQ
jgi:hypothetical protein